MVPGIILEEEEDGFINRLTSMINPIIHNTSYTPMEVGDVGVPTHLMLIILFLTTVEISLSNIIVVHRTLRIIHSATVLILIDTFN